jgi:uroporphyrinogen decarboxylase
MLRLYAKQLRRGLETITATTIEFIRAARLIGVDGIFLAVQHASADVLSEAEYREFGVEFDLRLLEAARAMWLNVIHLHGERVYFDLVSGYPAHVWNWHDRETYPNLQQGLAKVSGAVCGGIARDAALLAGTPQQVRAEVEDAVKQTGGRRLIVGTGCVTLIPSPEANLRVAREAVEL